MTGSNSKQNVPQQDAGVAGRQRKDRRRDEHGLRVLGESNPRCRRQMVRHLSSVERRRSPHGVDDVLVETREEPKPMLAGQPVLDGSRGAAGELMPARVLAIIGDGMLRAFPPGRSPRSSTTTSKPRSTNS